MPIYRAEKNKDYTVMSNARLKDMRLSLKAKGLLSYMAHIWADRRKKDGRANHDVRGGTRS